MKYRVGRKQGLAILEIKTGHEYLIFPKGKEDAAKIFCAFLNDKTNPLQFAEWCGENYVKLHGVWVHRFASQTDKSFWKTTEELYSMFLDYTGALASN